MIFEYDNSTHFLKAVLQSKTDQNPNYSMRSFAKKLGLSPGGLSLILNKKKKLSVARAYEVANSIELNSNEIEYFVTLVQLESSLNEKMKHQCLEKLKKLNPRLQNAKELRKALLNLEKFKMISKWYGLVILELLSEVENNWNFKTIQTYLNISKNELELMLERLIKLGLILEYKGIYKRITSSILVDSSYPNDGLRNYYKEIHKKSFESITEQTPNEKVIGTQVFAFDTDQLKDVEKLTYEYLDKLEELSLKGKNKTQVYQALANVFCIATNKEHE